MRLLFTLLLVPAALTLAVESDFDTQIQIQTQHGQGATKKTYQCRTYRDPHVSNFKGETFGDYHQGWTTMLNDGEKISVKAFQAVTAAWGKFASVQRFKIKYGKKTGEFSYEKCKKTATGVLSSGSSTYTMGDVKLSWSVSCGSSSSPMINLKIKFTTTAAGMKKAFGVCKYNQAKLKQLGLHREDLHKLHELAQVSETPKLLENAVKHCGGKETKKHLGCMWDFVVKWRRLEHLAHGSTDPELYKKATSKCKRISGEKKKVTCMQDYIFPRTTYKKMTFHAKHKHCHPLAYYWSKKAKDLLQQSKDNELLSQSYDKKSSKHALKAVQLEKKAQDTARKALEQLQNRQKDYKKFSADLHKKHKIIEQHSSSRSTALLELGASSWNWGSHFGSSFCQYNGYSNFHTLKGYSGNYFNSGYWNSYDGGYSGLDKHWHTMVNFEGFALEVFTTRYSVGTINRPSPKGRGAPWGSGYVYPVKLRITEGNKVYMVEADNYDAHLDVNGKRWSKYHSNGMIYQVAGSRTLFPNFRQTSRNGRSSYDNFQFKSKTGVIVNFGLYKYYAGNYGGHWWPYWSQIRINFNSKAKKNVAKSHGVFGMCAHRYPWEGATSALDRNGAMASSGAMRVLATCRKAGFKSTSNSRSSKMVKCVTKGKGIFDMPKTEEAMKICDFKKTFDTRCVKKVATQLHSGKYQSQDIGNHKCHDVGYHHWKKSEELLKVAADYRLLIKKSIGKTKQYRKTVKTLVAKAKLQAKYASDYFKKRAADYGSMANDLKKLHKIADKKIANKKL